MRDNAKSKAELLQEVETLRKRVTELEQCKDVTGRKKYEEEIGDSEERFRDLAARSFDLTFMTDAQGYLTYISAASEKIFHYKPEEMVGTHFKNYLVKSEIPRVSQRFAENMKGENLGISRMEAMRKDGSHVFIELNSSPIVKNGETIGIQGIIRDITEHKRAEDALRESEKSFREIFENIAVGVYRTTPDGQILMANPALVRMLGYSTFEELSQRNLEEEGFEPQYERSTFKEEIEREGRIVSSESTWITRDGKKLHVIENARAVRDEDGKTLYYEGTAENITERKKADEKLKQYQFMVESAHDVIFFKDLKSRYIIANNKTLEAFGLSREQVIGRSDYEIMPDKAEAAKNIEDDKLIFETGKPTEITKHMTGSDGKERWFQAIKVPQFDGEGNIIGLIGIARDITGQRKIEDKIRKLSSAVEQSIDGIAIGDLEPRLLYVNEAFAQMHGYLPEEMVGMPVAMLHNEQQMDEYNRGINQIKTQGSYEGEIGHIRRDGTAFPTYMSTTLLKSNGGKPIGILAVARDITESKRRETELNLYREKMSHAERLASLGTLSATIAHKLNTPLTAIRLSIENSLARLGTMSCPSSVIEDLQDGLSSVSGVVSTIDIFRDFARKSSVEIVSEVSLKAVAERIVRLLSESARQARVSLHLKGMDKLPLIRSNEKDLEQLFFALVENAIQAADGKKSRRLIVSGDVKDEHIELQFADNCGGIAPENLDKIFEPFFTTGAVGERTGLGLCIVEHIVSGADGKVCVESKAGKGSTFFVTLPISSRMP